MLLLSVGDTHRMSFLEQAPETIEVRGVVSIESQGACQSQCVYSSGDDGVPYPIAHYCVEIVADRVGLGYVDAMIDGTRLNWVVEVAA